MSLGLFGNVRLKLVGVFACGLLFGAAFGGVFLFYLLGKLVHLRLAFAFDAEKGASAGNAGLHFAGKLGGQGLLNALPAFLELVVHS